MVTSYETVWTKAVTESACDLTLARSCIDGGDYPAVIRIVDALPGYGGADGLRLKSVAQAELGLFSDAFDTLALSVDLVDEPRLKSNFHGQRAYIYRKMGQLSSALIEYEAARYWAQESSDDLVIATVRNNLAKVYSETQRFDESIAEVDAAIETFAQLGESHWQGRALDQKAQILLEHKQFYPALETSHRAVKILEPLGNQSSLVEARNTHAKAVVGYLNALDGFDGLKIRRFVAGNLTVRLEKELVASVLDQSQGNLTKAGQVLGISHAAMFKQVEKHKLDRKPKRRRPLSLLTPENKY